MKKPTTNESGFTLIEALIAFAILSSSLVVTFQIFTDGFRARSKAAIVLECEQRAARELSRLQVEARITGNIQTGTIQDGDGFQHIIVLGGLERNNGLQSMLRELRVTVLSPDETSSVTVSSLIGLSPIDG